MIQNNKTKFKLVCFGLMIFMAGMVMGKFGHIMITPNQVAEASNINTTGDCVKTVYCSSFKPVQFTFGKADTRVQIYFNSDYKVMKPVKETDNKITVWLVKTK